MSTEIDSPTISLDTGKVKDLALDSNTADAPTQTAETLTTDGSGGSPDRTADPTKTAEY